MFKPLLTSLHYHYHYIITIIISLLSLLSLHYYHSLSFLLHCRLSFDQIESCRHCLHSRKIPENISSQENKCRNAFAHKKCSNTHEMLIHRRRKTNEKLAHLLSVANLNSGFPAAKYFSCRGLNVMKEALKLSEKKGYLGSKCNRNLRVKNKGNI